MQYDIYTSNTSCTAQLHSSVGWWWRERDREEELGESEEGRGAR